jgi:[ribosomal protein S18]-alanine N-acetyltransferase
MMPELEIGPLRIRPMTKEDIAEVTRLDQESFSLPWPERAFENELFNQMARAWVVDQPANPEIGLIGSLILWLIIDEAHIATIAVDKNFRNQGIAKVLLAHALLSVREEGAICSLLEVRRSNTAALGLYQSLGFYQVGTRKGYYSDNHEDALLMNLDDLDSVDWQAILHLYSQRHGGG